MMDQRHADKSWAQKLPYVQAELRSNLDLIKRCSCDGQLHISNRVLSEELDVKSLRDSAHPVDRSRSVYSRSAVITLQQVIFDCVGLSIETSDSEITELRQLLESHGAHFHDRDASLMMAACKLSQSGIPSVLVTDDPDFYKPWRVLVQLETFSLGGTIYKADKLMLRGYAAFVTLAHDCCSCVSDKYTALLNAWLFPIIGRGITSLDQEGRTQLSRRISGAIRAMEASIGNKGK